MQDLEKILNPEQYQAVTAGDGPLLVLAAAGTGKTQTLVYRVAHLIESGAAPWSILLLTFTNRAAAEMLDRAKTVAGDSAGMVWGGTFHSICNRFLHQRNHASLLGYPSSFVIADKDDAKKLVDESMKELNLKGGDDFPKRDVVMSLISNAVNRNKPLLEVIEEKEGYFDDTIPQNIVRIRDTFVRKKMELGVMDFDDLLLNGLRLLKEHPEVLEEYRRQFRYVLVDEYQDTNSIQSEFVDLLAGENGNLTAVGDDFQCIYTWRGADFRNIMDFPTRYPGARIIKLERNYRSSPEILSLANECIKGNPEQFQKTLIATRPGAGKPELYNLYDTYQQSKTVSRIIREEVMKGRRYGDIAVLYRAHFHSIDLQMELTRNRLPFTITSGVGVFEQAHVKDMLSLLRLVNNPKDRLAFERLMSLLPGLGPRTVETMWVKLGGACDLSTPEGREALAKIVKPSSRGYWMSIQEGIDAYFDGGDGKKKDIVELVSAFVTAFYGGYLKKKYEDYSDRIDDVHEVALQISTSESLDGFLQEVALFTNSEAAYDKDPDKRSNTVRLSSVHQAKGLEWPVVIILWACEGMFPSSKAMAEGDDSEERRLFYVAVTRAKSRLVICRPEMRQTQDGGVYACQPSRFLSEVPQSNFRKCNFRHF